MQITVSFSGNPGDMSQLFGMLATLNLQGMISSANVQIPATSRDTAPRAFTPPPGEDDDDSSDIHDHDEEPVAPSPKKKAGRPKSTSSEKYKDAAKAAPVEPEAPAAEADEPDVDEPSAEAEHIHKLHSSNFKKQADQVEAMREVMQGIIKLKGANTVVSILGEFGAKRLAELPADKYNDYGARLLVVQAEAQSAVNDIL